MKISSYKIGSISNNIEALSSPPIDSSDVKDVQLRKAVESIGRPVRWWENNRKGLGYTFEIKGPGKSFFHVGMEENHNIFMFMGAVIIGNEIHRFSDASPIEDSDSLLYAISQPTPEKIIEAFHTSVGLTEE